MLKGHSIYIICIIVACPSTNTCFEIPWMSSYPDEHSLLRCHVCPHSLIRKLDQSLPSLCPTKSEFVTRLLVLVELVPLLTVVPLVSTIGIKGQVGAGRY